MVVKASQPIEQQKHHHLKCTVTIPYWLSVLAQHYILAM